MSIAAVIVVDLVRGKAQPSWGPMSSIAAVHARKESRRGVASAQRCLRRRHGGSGTYIRYSSSIDRSTSSPSVNSSSAGSARSSMYRRNSCGNSSGSAFGAVQGEPQQHAAGRLVGQVPGAGRTVAAGPDDPGSLARGQVLLGVGGHLLDQRRGQLPAGLHAAQQVLHHRRVLLDLAICASSIVPVPSVSAFVFSARTVASTCSSQARRNPSLEPKWWTTSPAVTPASAAMARRPAGSRPGRTGRWRRHGSGRRRPTRPPCRGAVRRHDTQIKHLFNAEHKSAVRLKTLADNILFVTGRRSRSSKWERTHARILDRALDLFERNGFEDTTVARRSRRPRA